jgi:outer membrane lipoprotein-sorting protein
MQLLRPVLLSTLLLTPCLAADPLVQTLARMEAASASFRGLRADLKRANYTAVIQDTDTKSGTIVVRRPRPKDLQMKIVIKEPEPQQFSYAGRTVHEYNPKTVTDSEYEVDKKYGGAVNEYVALSFGASPKDLRQYYTIALGGPETIEGKKTTRIELTPIKPDTTLHMIKAELWISDETGIAVQQKLDYAGGNYEQDTYSNMRIDANIPESAVQLDVPPNAKHVTVH